MLSELAPCRHWRNAHTRLWVREGVASPKGSWEDFLENAEAQLEAMASESNRSLGKGRGITRSVVFPSGELGVWRINRHGGALGGVFGANYFSSKRLEKELSLSDELRNLGVHTPEILLAVAVRQGIFWHHHLITREVEQSKTVFEARNEADARRASAELLEQVFELGLWATDLHPANLLWQPSTQTCWLIDLAGAKRLGRPLTGEERLRRRRRYLRFFEKHAGVGESKDMLG